MPKFSKIIKNSISKNIDNYTTIRTGEITADNGDGTYDVKIANASSAIPDVETMYYDAVFSVGEIVDIGFEYGSKESPRIMGHSKKIAQEPKEVEVDYSGGGLQTITMEPIYSGTNDGTIYNIDVVYNNSHDEASGSGKEDSDVLGGLGYFYANFLDPPIGWAHNCLRLFLFFDTSSIPSGAIITSASLFLREEGETGLEGLGFNVVVQNGQPTFPHTTLALSDFNKDYYSNNGGQVDAATILPTGYTEITLNSNGRNWINIGGTTKLCLRSSREIAGLGTSSTGAYYESIGIATSEKGTGYAPKLVITYTI